MQSRGIIAMSNSLHLESCDPCQHKKILILLALTHSPNKFKLSISVTWFHSDWFLAVLNRRGMTVFLTHSFKQNAEDSVPQWLITSNELVYVSRLWMLIRHYIRYQSNYGGIVHIPVWKCIQWKGDSGCHPNHPLNKTKDVIRYWSSE